MYNCNSKVEVRMHAVGMAPMFAGHGAGLEKCIEAAKEIEKYIIGGIELPEVYDPNAYLKDMTKIWETSFSKGRENIEMADENLRKALGNLQKRNEVENNV